MAGSNRNTFLKRQREIERTRRAREKMDRRHARKGKESDLSAAHVPPESSLELRREGGNDALSDHSLVQGEGHASRAGNACSSADALGAPPAR